MATYTSVPAGASWVATFGSGQPFDASFDKDGTTVWVFQQLGNGWAHYTIAGMSLIAQGNFFGVAGDESPLANVLQHDEGLMCFAQDDASHYFVIGKTDIYKLDVNMSTVSTLALASLTPSIDLGGGGSMNTFSTQVLTCVKSGGVNYLLVVGSPSVSGTRRATMWVINADTMAYVGSYVDTTVANVSFGTNGWMDKNGDLWMLGEMFNNSADLVQWHPADGAAAGTLNVTVHNVSAATLNFGLTNGVFDAAYDPDNHAAIISGFAIDNGVYLSVIEMTTFTRTAFRTDDNTVGYTNWLDGTESAFLSGIAGGGSAFGINGDETNIQGANLKILDKTTLAVNTTVDIGVGINAAVPGAWQTKADADPGYPGVWDYNPINGTMLAGFSNLGVSSGVFYVSGLPTFGAGDVTAPTAPSGLSATAASTTQVDLSWTAATDDTSVLQYHVERCTGGACAGFVEIATVVAPAVIYSDALLSPSTAYRYRVRAEDSVNLLGSYSNIAIGVTPPATPIYPPPLISTGN